MPPRRQPVSATSSLLPVRAQPDEPPTRYRSVPPGQYSGPCTSTSQIARLALWTQHPWCPNLDAHDTPIKPAQFTPLNSTVLSNRGRTRFAGDSPMRSRMFQQQIIPRTFTTLHAISITVFANSRVGRPRPDSRGRETTYTPKRVTVRPIANVPHTKLDLGGGYTKNPRTQNTRSSRTPMPRFPTETW